MRVRNCFVAGMLVLAAACAESATAPAPDVQPARDGGGLMGSGTRTEPPPPPPTPEG